MTDYLTIQEAAAIARVSVSTMRRWVKEGLEKKQGRKGTRVLIERGELERYLAHE